ncbi:MAG: NAD-dependent epimerase/dehydratase family protein [Pseudomonadota bacterium]
MATRQVGIVGAGFIAGAHIAALRQVKSAEIVAIVDPNKARASTVGKSLGNDVRVFTCADDCLSSVSLDAVHVLTPPPVHEASALPWLKAGIDVLLEKPMAETVAQCDALLGAAAKSDAGLIINHNFVYHPTFARARRLLENGRVGQLRQVQMRYAVPLRQMAARQFGHWMFNEPRNLLLEQVIHPLSQLDVLLGGITFMEAKPGPAQSPAEGINLVTDWQFSSAGADGQGQLQVFLGASFPSWTISILCDDGVIEADIFEGRVTVRSAHNDIPPLDMGKRNLIAGLQGVAEGARAIGEFSAEMLRLMPASDGFTRSMIASVQVAHENFASRKDLRPDRGQRLVGLCEAAATTIRLPTIQQVKIPQANEKYDVAVLGGTGFIGQHLVSHLVNAGKRVAVMARNTANLPAIFDHPSIGVFRGSIADRTALEDILSRAPSAVNLAHGGGGANRDEVAENMVGGAEAVAQIAGQLGLERLIFVSSSAALYLGDENDVITIETPPDPLPDERGDYARAKVLAEHAMLTQQAVPVVILRPAVVVGEGGSPFHSALGAYENETHCAGWNAGRNPLPFVLAEDVADAIIKSLEADLETVKNKTFNLAGDVRWSARQYTEELANGLRRPLKFHGSQVRMLMAMEWLRWSVKKVAGRKGIMEPSDRDIRSRGMVAHIDTTEEKRLLDWHPCADEAMFRARAIDVHKPKTTAASLEEKAAA